MNADNPKPDDDAVRAKVLQTADRLYYTYGIQAVGMDMLRTESGVPHERLYRLFPSKETIVEQVLLGRHETWNSLVEHAVDVSDPRERLLAIYDMLARWFDQDDFRGCVFINSFGELGATTPRVAEIVRAHKAVSSHAGRDRRGGRLRRHWRRSWRSSPKGRRRRPPSRARTTPRGRPERPRRCSSTPPPR